MNASLASQRLIRLRAPMRQVLLILGGVILGVCAVAIAFTTFEAHQERVALTADLEYRTTLLSESLKESIEPAFGSGSVSRLQKLVSNFSGREKLIGIAVYDADGHEVATSTGLGSNEIAPLVARQAIERNVATGELTLLGERKVFAHAAPLQSDGRRGALVIVQDASYIDTSVSERWRDNFFGVLAYLFLFTLAVAALVRYAIFRPLMHLVDAIQSARSGKPTKATTPRDFFFRPLATEIAKLTTSLSQARTAASEEARMRLEKIDSPWTAERLKEFIKAYVKGREIFVVSDAEPYVHTKTKGEIRYYIPASGLVTALESVMDACGGLWIARGKGDADRETVDEDDKIRVPPDEPKYTLKRVWLDEDEIKKYYIGFANEALWPLCHMAHMRPTFRKDDWLEYVKVNEKFAATILEEIEYTSRPIILIQDFHFTLVPRLIKKARPDAQIGIFWHVPWPNSEAFSICPWRKEILDGMLGADIIGFHTQQFCNNFMDTVSKEIESLTDFEHFAITRDRHTTHIKAFPIGTAFVNGMEDPPSPDRSIFTKYGITAKYVGIGVDRTDYIKGLVERCRAVEFLLDVYPEYVGQFTLLQILPPSKSVEKNQQYGEEVKREITRVNEKFGTDSWKPIVLANDLHTRDELAPLYRAADVCLVTSLHDGMNLVSKEFVAARDDETGALVLSQFTGASRDLKGALVVNPYSAEETSEAIHIALTMPREEQRRRMQSMRHSIKDYNVYRWAAEFIKAVASLG